MSGFWGVLENPPHFQRRQASYLLLAVRESAGKSQASVAASGAAWDASASRTRGATRVPSSSIARISFACGNAATLIWKVRREMPPTDSFTRRIFSATGFRISHEERSGGSEQGVEVCPGNWRPAAFLADLRKALRITGKEVAGRLRRTLGDVTQ
jgi:hypothetical protein